MLEFIPFIPANTNGVDNHIWQTALKSWTFNLIELLDGNDNEFLVESKSSSFLQFVDQVLTEQMDGSVNTELLKYIYLIHVRLCSLEAIARHPLLTADRLCRFVVVYLDANTERVRNMIQDIISQDSLVEQQLLTLLNSMISTIQSLPHLLDTPTTELLHRAYIVCRVTSLLLSSIVLVQTLAVDNLDLTLIDCYQQLNPKLEKAVNQDPETASYAYLIKKSLVACFDAYTDMTLFLPLQQHKITQLDLISERILKYIEDSGLDQSRSAFVDGPLVLDWEVAYSITNKLAEINQQMFDNEEDRLEFLKLSMEQVRDTNSGTGTWGDSLNKVDPDVELMTKISKVHELFPELGEGFIEACLDANQGNEEQVIMQLLEDNLPPSVSGLERSMPRHAEAEGSILQSRHNIYDNDEFDVFNRGSVDHSKVYKGKKNKENADALLDDKSFIQSQKKNVIQRVVDMYDDEYDDTYDDINDAGVPSAINDEDKDAALDVVKKKQQQDIDLNAANESVLVHTFMESPSLFTDRKSKKHAELKKLTGMSDEQLKGWAVMFNRNPRKQRILDKYMLFDGNQAELTEETSHAQKQANNNKDKKPPVSEARDRAYKDKNKARFGNHNRKNNRDKKLAKASPIT